MQVETYEVEPIEQSEMQALAAEGETIELIESLGLEGQRALMNPETKSVIPYRHLTAEERFVFKTLFPNQANITAYKSGPIPLRVLQVAAHCQTLGMKEMAYLEVWYPKQGIDDPVLVARPSYYQDPIFLLARWGAALLPFDELMEAATKKAIDQARAKLQAGQRTIEATLANVEDYVRGKIADGEIPHPMVSL